MEKIQVWGFLGLCLVAWVHCLQGNSLRVGAFNIQIFGQSKSKKPEVMAVLVKIIQRYDILLIQEIRDSQETAIVRLLAAVNEKETGNPFEMKVSARLGRQSSKEQYAFFYRPGSGLTVDASFVYMDTKDVFEREPFIVSFKSTGTKLKSFVFGGNHIKPDAAEIEIDHLKDVFADVKSSLKANDIMMMGDMNADCGYVTKTEFKEVELRHDPKYKWWIGDDVDTTVAASSCAYDRFISIGQGFLNGIDPNSIAVFRFDTAYNIPLTGDFKASHVSDHYPIEFELIGGVTSRPTQLLVITNIRVAVIGTSLSKTKHYNLNDKLNVMLPDGSAGATAVGPLPVTITGTNNRKCLLDLLANNLVQSALTLTPVARKYGGTQNTYVSFSYYADDLSRIKVKCHKIMSSIIYDV